MTALLTPSPHRARGLFTWLRGAAAAWVIAVSLTPIHAQTAASAGNSPAQSRPGYDFLDTQEKRQFDIYHGLLTDTMANLEDRTTAAAAMLDSGWTVSIRALLDELQHKDEVGTQRAIARAVSQVESPSPRLIQPLVNLLGADNIELRRDVAAALGCYQNERLVDQLIALATGKKTADAQRRGAIRALAEHRNREVIETLLEVAVEADPLLRPLVFDSLARLTGIKGYGDNLATWQAWWQQARKLDDAELLASLLRNIAARNADANQHLQARTAQLVSTYVRLYDATAEANRAAVLELMLHDPLADLRLEALKLIERRLLNVQPIDESTRGLVRQVLGDEEPAIQIAAAKQLETMADVEGIARAAELLPDEPDESVQRAFLTLMSRVPSETAVDLALERMTMPAVRGPAMSVIAVAAENNKLTEDQAARARARLRGHLAEAPTPDPTALKLLGRLGDAGDEPLLANYLGHPDLLVKMAAAEALSADRWPLQTLLDHLNDPKLGPYVTQVVGRRGADVSELVKLLAAEPAEVDHQRPWRDAAVSICTRLDTEELIALDQLMRNIDNKPRWSLYEEMLTAAAKLKIDPQLDDELAAQLESRRWEADFLLGEFYLYSAQPGRMADPISRLLARNMITDAQKRRLSLLQLSALLHTPDAEEDAVKFTMDLLADKAGPSADTVAEKWIQAIERVMETKAEDSRKTAKGLCEAAWGVFDGKLTGAALATMTRLRDDLAMAGSESAAEAAATTGPSARTGDGTLVR